MYGGFALLDHSLLVYLGTLKLAGKLTVHSRLVVRQHRALSITGSHHGFIVTKRVGVGVYRPLQLSEGRKVRKTEIISLPSFQTVPRLVRRFETHARLPPVMKSCSILKILRENRGL